MKLLIVDDSVLMQDRIKIVVEEISELQLIGQALNSFDAIELYKQNEPDIVILDIRLPGENGVKILERIKKINPITKIIVLTNYPFQQYEKKCKEFGAEYFLDKSNDFDKLGDVLNKIIQKK